MGPTRLKQGYLDHNRKKGFVLRLRKEEPDTYLWVVANIKDDKRQIEYIYLD